MANSVKYYHLPGSKPKASGLDGVLPDKKNPIFNFDADFFSNLNSINATELGQAIPYIHLYSMDLQGNIIEDFSLDFFHKAADLEEIKKGKRNADRPIMSLKELIISTDNASGYLYYTNVTLKIKLHSPDALSQTTLMSLTFPGMPHLLEYGWNSPGSSNKLLSGKERLLFSVKSYQLTLDATGQVDLTVEGMTFNERFGSTLVGDTGVAIDTKKTKHVNEKEFDGVFANVERLNKYIKYLNEIKERTGKNSNDYALVAELAEIYKSNEKRARGNMSKRFTASKKRLYDPKICYTKEKVGKLVRLHDLVKALLDDTFSGMRKQWPTVGEFRVIYGNFNDTIESAGIGVNKSIADFPIQIKQFDNLMKADTAKGQFVPTINKVLNSLIRDFLENEEYWKDKISSKTQKEFHMPKVHFNFSNRGDMIELTVTDIREGVPPTLTKLPREKGSQAEAERSVIGDTGLPILKLGHANSFIKTITLSQISDEYMKAALIERMARDRTTNPRQTKVPGLSLSAKPVTPLTLPLRGSAELLGMVEWKPFRSFYLSAGIFVIDAIYKITKVTHRLSPGSFNTSIDFIYH